MPFWEQSQLQNVFYKREKLITILACLERVSHSALQADGNISMFCESQGFP